jgi:phospholipid/cholesterol/gamma-HCH transport system ATP-binding protein
MTTSGPDESTRVRSTPLLLAEDLVKSYVGQLVLDHVSLHADRGETVVIVGRSGSGKSTLIRPITGLERPDAGRVVIADIDILALSEVNLLAARRQFAVVFQNGALLDSLTVFDNVAFPLREELALRGPEIGARVMAKLEALSIASARDKLPGELSGGMAKRVGVARALVTEPELLVYDEPTTGLDPLTARQVDHLIEEMRDRFSVTSLVITHDMATAYETADRVMLLEKGRFVAEGPTEEFFASDVAMIRTFADSSGFEPKKLAASRVGRKTPAQIREARVSSTRRVRGRAGLAS